MDIFATYATDETKEEEGVVVFLEEGKKDQATDAWVKVARIGNTAYSKVMSKNYESLQTQKKTEGLSETEVDIRSKNLLIETLASTVLKSFGNLEFQGKPLTPSPESNLMLMRVKDFREKVYMLAADVDRYKFDTEQASTKN